MPGRREPERMPERVRSDERLSRHVERVHEDHWRVYGAPRSGVSCTARASPAARCTVERLMRRFGLRGVTRGKV